MTYGTGALRNLPLFKCGGDSFQKARSQTIFGSVSLAFSLLAGACALHPQSAAAASVDAKQAATSVTIVEASSSYVALLDPTLMGAEPVSLAESAPLKSSFQPFGPAVDVAELETTPSAPSELDESIPFPTPRPSESRPPARNGGVAKVERRVALQNRATVRTTSAPDNRSFFEKLFFPPQSSTPALAYAPADGGIVRNAQKTALATPSSSYDRWTAVYDIAAHTVYMPNGTRLEAHSGLGQLLDDPRYVGERNRGATPPNIYELQPREQLFHGVQALRLNPVGGTVFGRTGLLAHTYMLGPNGDSNGCVSFRNYNAFLQAYMNGEVKRLAVVARMN